MAKHEGYPETRERWHQFNDINAGELLEWCWANNLAYEDVRITHVALKWFWAALLIAPLSIAVGWAVGRQGRRRP